MQQARRGRRRVEQRRVVGQPAGGVQPGRLRRELASGDVPREPHRRRRRRHAVLVDPGDLRAEPARDALAVREVAGPHRDACRLEPAASAIAAASSAVSTSASTGPGTGSCSSARVRRDGAQHGGGEERARRAGNLERPAAQPARARRLGGGDERLDAVPVLRARERADLGVRPARVAHAEVPGGLGDPAGERERRAAARRSRARPPAWRRPPPANAAHSAPVTARSSGAPSSTSIVPLAARRVQPDDLRGAVEVAGPDDRQQLLGQAGADERAAHARRRRAARRAPAARRCRRAARPRPPAAARPTAEPSRTWMPTTPNGACTSVERRPARSAGTGPSRRSASASGPSPASPCSPPTDGRISASIASLRGWPASEASRSASSSSSSSTAFAARRR